MTLYSCCAANFFNFPFRKTCISLADFDNSFGFHFEKFPGNCNIDYLVRFCEYSYDDDEGREANLHDDRRIEYVKSVLHWAHQAIQDGIDLRGYYLWSLMDNFEWSAGYCARYGLYYTDYETFERIPKDSAKWYAGVTRSNGFEE